MTSPDRSPVVVGVDGSPGSEGALRYAVAEAARRDARLQLVHVLPSPTPAWPIVPMGVVGTELQDVGSAILARAVDKALELAPGLEITTLLSAGSRSAGLVEAAAGAQLVVLGRETQHGLDRLLVGAVTAAVAARAGCVVAVIPSFWTADHAHGRVVAAIKSRLSADEVLGEAFRLASARGSTLTLVTAWELPDQYLDRIEVRTHAEEWEVEGRRVIDELVASVRTAYPDVAVDVRVQHGHAAAVLLAASRESDMLLLSRRHHALPPYGHLGGTARTLLRLSDVPVVVVPHTGVEGLESQEPLVLEESGTPLK